MSVCEYIFTCTYTHIDSNRDMAETERQTEMKRDKDIQTQEMVFVKKIKKSLLKKSLHFLVEIVLWF